MPNYLVRFVPAKPPQMVNQALRALVRDAYKNVPYYRALMEARGITPDMIQGSSDLSRLPATSKTALLTSGANAYLHKHADPTRCYRTSTSGSQGVPLTISFSRAEALWRRAMVWRTMMRYALLHPPLTIADVGPMAPHANHQSAKVAGWVRLLRLPATMPIANQLSMLLDARPAVIEGYPTCLALLAEALEQRGSVPWRPQLIVSRGEVLHAETRAGLERLFSCPVADLYNCEEIGNVAWSCPHDPCHWHINTSTCIVEIVDAGDQPLPPGVEGRILLTSLFGRTMPFLRYEIGDRAAMNAPTRCSCGVHGPTLTHLNGRDDDFLVLPDGQRISPRMAATTVVNCLKARDTDAHTQPIRQFQIIQQGNARLTLRVVLHDDEVRTPAGQPLMGQALAQQAALALSAFGLPCNVEEVTTIPFAPSGKFKKVLVIP
ncbi:MAG: Phenylacetate-coenzyme A ligase [Chloroflexi bacterium ADurb.Bin360]|nr:MAG: Phenylacetate-coenzyme A ligase [Chloroflexi bacterium ADurb.Bin360]